MKLCLHEHLQLGHVSDRHADHLVTPRIEAFSTKKKTTAPTHAPEKPPGFMALAPLPDKGARS